MSTEAPSLREELILEEYRSLRAQLDYQVRDNRELERYAVLGVGVVFAWLAPIEHPTHLVLPAWLVPPLIALHGRLRASTVSKRIDQLATYIQGLESQVRVSGSLSPAWETTLAQSRKRGTSPGLGANQRLFWRVLIAFSAAGSIYGFICHHFHF